MLSPIRGDGIPRGARVVVLGLGRSGTSAAALVIEAGGVPILADDDVASFERPAVRSLRDAGALLPGDDPLRGADLVVTSPGVPSRHPLLAEAACRGIPIWGELELSFRYCPAPLLAVTGSDGKSTTTALVAHLIAQAGRRVVVGGNIGTPLSSLVPQMRGDELAVVEVSSYQLETTTEFRPWVATLLNVAPDHLERHGSLEAYARAKARIFSRQGRGDFRVVNADRPGLLELCPPSEAQTLLFSATSHVRDGACLEDGWLTQVEGGRARRILPAERLRIIGQHNVENALAALATVLPVGLVEGALGTGLASFRPLPHRIEPVGRVAGVTYVNDSKATNVHSAIAALASMDRPVILLVGGKDKGLSFAPLAEAARDRVRVALAFGHAGPRLAEALSPVVETRQVADLQAAVEEAARLARPGEVVLLSPACSSFDAYASFEERGAHFRRLVASLEGFSAEEDQDTPK